MTAEAQLCIDMLTIFFKFEMHFILAHFYTICTALPTKS